MLTPGQRGEATQLEALVEGGSVYQPLRRGRPRLRPKRLAGDKAYTGRPIRSYLRRRGIGAVIARQKTERAYNRVPFDQEAYRKRNRIERLINRLKQFRRVATRYEKRAANYLAMLTLAAITLWL